MDLANSLANIAFSLYFSEILFVNIVVNFLALNSSPSNGGIVNQSVCCTEFLSVTGFTSLVEIASRFHDFLFSVL